MSKEAWGAIATVTVALITASVTLTTHYWSPKPAASAPAEGSVTADPIAGRWAGTATDANNTSFKIEVDIARGCALSARCGTISVSHVPCKGSIFLNNVNNGDFEFRVDEFQPGSAAACSPGGGEHFQLGQGGTLFYTTSYEPKAHSVLTRQN